MNLAGEEALADARLEASAGEAVLRRTVPAWLLSFLLHSAVLAVLVRLVDLTPQGAREEGDRTTGIVVAARTPKAISYLSEEAAGGAPAAAPATAPAALAQALPRASEAPPTPGAGLPQAGATEAGPPATLSVPGAAGVGQGTGVGRARGAGTGYQAETGVFGLKGQGSRFLYVFDRSFSMAGYGGRPLAAAKRELLASIQVLEKVHQFQVIFYNERPRLIVHTPGEPPRMFFGDEAGKRLAESFIRGMPAEGGTRHLEALVQALDLAPDVIFFLTDADDPQLSAAELALIRRRNKGAAINAIEFGSGPSSGGRNFLHRLASENGGAHVYVDVTQLPPP